MFRDGNQSLSVLIMESAFGVQPVDTIQRAPAGRKIVPDT